MTLQTTIPIADYVENGVTLLHAIPFQFGAATDIVCSRIANGVEAVLTLGADYTVSGGNSSTGTVTKTSGGTLGTIFRIKRATSRAQQMDYTAGDAFPAESHEAQLDRLSAVDQEQDVAISDLINRAVHVPVGESAQTLPTKTQMIGKYLAGDASGNIVPASGTGSDPALRTDLAASSGTALLGFIHAGANSVARSVQSKLRDLLNVADKAALDPTGVVNSAAAFTAAVADLPAAGGRIGVGPGTYKIDTDPASPTKSILWDIAPDAVFTGAANVSGGFPFMLTNPAQKAVGPYIRSHTAQVSPVANGGVSAWSVEIDPAAVGAGQWVAAFFGARAAIANAAANHWAINAVMRVEATALGTQQAIEVDVDNFSASAIVKGISISGGGTRNVQYGIEITRLAMQFGIGVTVAKAVDAVVLNGESGGRGLVVHAPGAVLVQGIGGTAASLRQFANGQDTILLQRFTDTAPTGQLIRAIDAANTKNLFILAPDGTGLFGGGLTISPPGTAPAQDNGQLSFVKASDTSLQLKLKGSDGVVRSSALTFA